MQQAVAEFGPHLIPYEVDEFTSACNNLAQQLRAKMGDQLGEKSGDKPSNNIRGASPIASSISFQAANFIRVLRTLKNQSSKKLTKASQQVTRRRPDCVYCMLLKRRDSAHLASPQGRDHTIAEPRHRWRGCRRARQY